MSGEPPPTLFPGHWAERTPDAPATTIAETGETMTYRELDTFANRLANWLRSLGVEAGDHVAFCMENRLDYLAIMWGCHYAGTYYTALSSRLNAEESAYIVENCGAKVLIVSPYVASMAEDLVDTTPGLLARMSVGGTVVGYDSLENALKAVSDAPLPQRLETNDMLYSSGTTGRPKGVKVASSGEPLGTGDGVTALAQALFGFTGDFVYLSPGPLYHAAPLRFCRSTHRTGGHVVVLERFDPHRAMAAIESYGVTTSQWVPTMFIRMLKLPEDERSQYDVTSLRYAIHAAAPCPIDAKEQMIDWWGPIIHEYYAGTEGNGLTYCNSEDWLTHKGTVGRAVLGTLHIVDEEGNDLPPGEEGGVFFSGAGEFEYHLDPDKTAGARESGGRSTLGDIGRMDEDGFLYLTDRKAFTIISGGVNIYPQEAENVLAMHPDVLDAAVFGVPDPDMGEAVKAVVQPREMPVDEASAAALEAALIDACRGQLAGLKCPRSIDFREELPRHPTGKLYKRLLRDEYWAEHRDAQP